jgi:tuftelin-interacting protein 11
MQQINLVVDDINVQAKDLASVYEVSLDPFSPHFSKLLVQFPSEFDRYRLDEIVVAAIAPLVSLFIIIYRRADRHFWVRYDAW